MRLVKALWVLLVLAVLVFVASNGVKALEAPQAIPQGGMPVGDGVLFVFDIDGRAEHVFAEVDDFGNGYNVWLGGSIPCNQLVVYQSGFGVYHGMAEISGCLVRLSLPNFQVLNEGFGKIGKPQYASGCTGTYGDYGTVVGCAEVMLKLAGYCPEVSNILDQYLCALGASKDLPIESWTVSQAVKDWSLNRPPFDRVALVTRGAVNADQLIKAISCLWVRDITLASDQAVECVGFLLYLDQSPPQPALRRRHCGGAAESTSGCFSFEGAHARSPLSCWSCCAQQDSRTDARAPSLCRRVAPRRRTPRLGPPDQARQSDMMQVRTAIASQRGTRGRRQAAMFRRTMRARTITVWPKREAPDPPMG